MFNSINAFGYAALDATCVIGSTTDSKMCGSGLFCKGNTTTGYNCSSCSDLTDPAGTYTLSDPGSDAATECYKECPTLDSSTTPVFSYGSWTSNNGGIAYYDDDCEYTDLNNITCINGYEPPTSIPATACIPSTYTPC